MARTGIPPGFPGYAPPLWGGNNLGENSLASINDEIETHRAITQAEIEEIDRQQAEADVRSLMLQRNIDGTDRFPSARPSTPSEAQLRYLIDPYGGKEEEQYAARHADFAIWTARIMKQVSLASFDEFRRNEVLREFDDCLIEAQIEGNEDIALNAMIRLCARCVSTKASNDGKHDPIIINAMNPETRSRTQFQSVPMQVQKPKTFWSFLSPGGK
jgi:hypothetical protein